MYYDLDDNIDNITIPDEFIEITSLLKIHRKNIRKKMLKLLHCNFDEFCEDSKKQIMDIMEYAIFSGGKHYRSFFVELLGKSLGVNLPKILFIGSIIEMVHNYIIMQEAMPDLENDDFRHKRESCHKKFGNAQTIVASNALYSLIMEIITSDSSVRLSSDLRCNIIKIISKYSGKDGISCGQMMKLMYKKTKIGKDEKTRIKILKLNSLFEAGAECIESIVNLKKEEKNNIKFYINNLCNLITLYEYAHNDNDIYKIKEILEKAHLFTEQGVKCISKNKDSDLLISFIKYNNYCINKIFNEQIKNKPIVITDNADKEKLQNASL